MTDANEKNIKDILGTDAASQEVAEKAVAEAKKDLDEEMRLRRIKLIKLGSILMFIAIVMVIMTLGWFSMNKETSANGGGVKVATNDFEIRVSGNNIGAKSYNQSGTGNGASYSGTDIMSFSTLFGKYTDGAEGTIYDTDGANPEIKWRLTTEYDAKEDKGLGPGSQGSLTFWIVPKRTGTLDPVFSLRLDGYVAPNQHKNENGSYQVTESDLTKITSASDPAQIAGLNYLNGHILFFNHRDGVGSSVSYTGLLDKNEFTLSDVLGSAYTVTAENMDTQIEVTIYWVWPNTFGQMVLSGSENSNRLPIVTEEDTEDPENPDNVARKQARSDIQDYVLDNISTIFDLSKMTFADGITTDEQKTSAVRDMMTTSSGEGENTTYTFSSTKTADNLSNLSSGYNNADQDIGTNVNYVLIALEVSQ